MKLAKDETKKDFGHEKFEFRIDQKHQQKAILALINLYQNKIYTPVQEIICNARDAHREIGKPEHSFNIQVTDSQFIVRDFGSGISPDKAKNIFCSIGESTKTNDNTQTGGFGIGAKSPLAYTNQFEVVSYVNGIEYHYIIAKNGESLEMNLISESTSDLTNGTKVIIPIKNSYDKKDFINAVEKTCTFWEQKPNFNHTIESASIVKADGINGGYYKASDLFSGYSGIILVDGIPYNYRNYSNRNQILIFNTGEIRLHETRERLGDSYQDKEFNTKQIGDKFDNIYLEFHKNTHKYIDKNNIFNDVNKLIDHGVKIRYDHKGITFAHTINYPNELPLFISRKGYRYRSGYQYERKNSVSFRYDTEVFFNDINDTDNIVSRKVKNYIQTFINDGKEKQVVVITNRDHKDLLNARNLSELSLPEKKKGEKKVKVDNIINGIVLKPHYQIRTNLDLQKVNSTYLYTAYNDDVGTDIRNFCINKGMKIVKLSKENISKVFGNKYFIDYNKWLKSYELTQEEKNDIYSRKALSVEIKVNNSILDEKLKRHNELCNKYVYSRLNCQVPKVLYSEEVNKEIEKIHLSNAEIKLLRDYTEKNYPLMGLNSEQNTEYVNALYLYRKNYTTQNNYCNE